MRASHSGETELPTLRELKAFIAVARCESLTRAAEELSYFNPSSVLYHIKSLERKYDVELFFHKRKRMQLTEQGQILYSGAEEILRKLGDIEMAMAERPPCLTKITLGGPLLSLSLMRVVYGRICNETPTLQVRFVSYWESNDVESALLREEIDAGILYQPPGKGGHFQLTAFQESVLVAAAANPILGDGTMITRDQLSQQNLVVPRTNSDQSVIFDQVMGQLKIKFRSVDEAPSLPVVMRLVKMGRGVTLLPAITARETFGDPSSQLLRIVDADPGVDLMLAYSPDKADSNGIKSLVQALHSVLAEG